MADMYAVTYLVHLPDDFTELVIVLQQFVKLCGGVRVKSVLEAGHFSHGFVIVSLRCRREVSCVAPQPEVE